jgi:hypothetical protein
LTSLDLALPKKSSLKNQKTAARVTLIDGAEPFFTQRQINKKD